MNRRIVLRTALTVAAAVGAVAVGASSATAADDPAPTQGGGLGDLLQDSRGIPLSSFTLDLNDGNRLNPGDTGKLVWALIMQAGWELYKLNVAGMIFMLEWVMRMEWIDWIFAPLIGFAKVTDRAVSMIGIGPLMLTVLGAVVAYWLFRGRYGGGIAELLIGCTVAALATGILANPMGVIGGDDGLIMGGRDAGIDLATALATDGESMSGADTDTFVTGISAQLVDTMIRIPHQIANYGAPIDGTSCEATYDEWVGKEDARENIRECDPWFKAYADNPSPYGAANVWEMFPSSLVFALFTYVLVALMIATVLGAGWQGIKTILLLPMGVVPGAPRAALFKSLAMALYAAVLIALVAVFIVGWMKLLELYFSNSTVIPWAMRMRIFNTLLVVGLIVLFLMRHKVKKGLTNLAARVAALGPKPSTLPKPVLMPAASAAAGKAMRMGYQAWLHRKKPPIPSRPPIAPRTTPAPLPAPASNQAPPRVRPELQPGTAPLALPPGGSGVDKPSNSTPGLLGGAPRRPQITAAEKLRQRTKKAVSLAAQGGAMLASGGTSAAATSAKVATVSAKAAKVARAAKVVQGAVDVAGAARSERNAALREKLQAARMRPTDRGAVDEGTGVRYRSRTVETGGGRVELFEREHTTVAPAPSVARPKPVEVSDPGAGAVAARLRERLAGRASSGGGQ